MRVDECMLILSYMSDKTNDQGEDDSGSQQREPNQPSVEVLFAAQQNAENVLRESKEQYINEVMASYDVVFEEPPPEAAVEAGAPVAEGASAASASESAP